MSDYNASSFETDYEYNGRVWTAGGSSQSTQTSDSSFEYNRTNFSQVSDQAVL